MPKAGPGQYPLVGAVRWYIEYWKARAMARTGDGDKQKKTSIETKILEAKYLEATKHLIPRADVVLTLGTAYGRLGKMFEQLPPSLGREFNLPPEITDRIRETLDDARRGFVKDCVEFRDVFDAAPAPVPVPAKPVIPPKKKTARA
jgi:hypothetical protein